MNEQDASELEVRLGPTGEAESSSPRSAISDAWDQYIRPFSESAHSEFSSIATEVTERVAEPLSACLRQTGEAHAALVGKLGTAGEVEGAVGQLQLSAFRTAAAAEISAPLLEILREINAAAFLTQMVLGRLERLREVAERAPEQIVLPDEAEIYLASQGDRFNTRLRKLWLRGIRRLGSWRHAGASLALRVVRRAPRLRIHDSLQYSIARCYAKLERSATDWSFGLFEADGQFGLDDRVSLHDHDYAGGAKDGGTQKDAPSSHIDMKHVVAAADRLAGEKVDFQLGQIADQFDQLQLESESQLLADLVSAGTPLLRFSGRHLPDDGSRTVGQLKASSDRWIRWHQQLVNRFTLNHSVLVLRETLADRAEQILRGIKNAALDPILAAFDEAERLIDEANRSLDRAFAGQEAHRSADALRRIEQAATQGIGRTFRSTVAREAQSFLTDPGVAHWKELTILVTQLPGDLMVHRRGRDVDREVEPGKRPFTINLREIASNALSPAWPALLSEAAGPLKAAITRTWVQAERLQHVIDYNLGAAIDELVGADQARRETMTTGVTEEGSPPPTPQERAFQLAADAVRRSGELVEELRQSLAGPWSEFTRTFDAAVHDDWQDLINQVKSDDLMMERWVGMRTRALRQVERTQDQVELLWRRGVSAAKQRAGVAHRYATKLLRRGRSAVGVVDAAEEPESTIAEALQGAERVRKALPLVYRRLFGFGVVTDDSLLEGRGRDLVSVRKRFERWKSSGGPGTLILTAPLGSGRTSFLEALRSKVFDECSVKIVALRERVGTVDQLIAALSEILGTPQRARGLEQLEAALTLRTRDGAPLVIVIDDLEHLILQSADGADLLRRLLNVMLRTDHAVFWLAMVSEEAWRYARVAASAAVASIGTYALAPLDCREVEELILGRHHRSGMTLHFVAPKDCSPILKRRLRRARTGERQQEILKQLFFDNLCRHSGNDLSLTMLYWLRSVQFEDDEDVVTVRPLEPISFVQLRHLDLAQLFALRAFVVHNTLTAAELGLVLRVTVDRAVLLLESLINLAVIERVHADRIKVDQPSDAAADRFRLSRVVLYPVLDRLRGAHVIY